jgi:hypothetical protein
VSSSFGAVALLASFGYVTNVAFQSRLGYALEPGQSVATNVVLSANFAASLFSETAAFMLDHWVISLVAAVTLVAVRYLMRRKLSLGAKDMTTDAPQVVAKPKPKPQPFGRLSSNACMVVAIGVLTASKFVILDTPNLLVRDLLVNGVNAFENLGTESFQARIARAIYIAQICARLAEESGKDDLQRARIECDGESSSKQLRAEAFLRSFYVANIWLSIVIVWLAFRSATLFPLICVIIVAVTVPASYARLRMPTVFDEVIVDIEEGSMEDSQAHAFLLAMSNSSVTLYHKEDQHLWTLPNSRLRRVLTERRADVLTTHFKLGVSQLSDTPPPPI